MKRVCILGCAPSWKYAPFQDNTIEIWTLNGALINLVPRFTRHFDVHIPFLNYHKGNERYSEWLHNNQYKLWILDKSEELPNANVINYRQLLADYGNYFTNSISWMIASAIKEGYNEIYLYGVDLAQKTEWEYERPSVEYFVGIAKGKGIEVIIQPCSKILKNDKIYGII